MERLSGKTALITGASSGIGLEAAKLFSSEGAKVVLAARRQNALDDVVSDIENRGGVALAVAGDVTDERYARELRCRQCSNAERARSSLPRVS